MGIFEQFIDSTDFISRDNPTIKWMMKRYKMSYRRVKKKYKKEIKEYKTRKAAMNNYSELLENVFYKPYVDTPSENCFYEFYKLTESPSKVLEKLKEKFNEIR